MSLQHEVFGRDLTDAQTTGHDLVHHGGFRLGDGSGRKEDANKPKFKTDHPSEVIVACQANESVARNSSSD